MIRMNLIEAIDQYETALAAAGQTSTCMMSSVPPALREAAGDLINVMVNLHSRSVDEGYEHNGKVYSFTISEDGQSAVVALRSVRNARDVAELDSLYGHVPDHRPGEICPAILVPPDLDRDPAFRAEMAARYRASGGDC